MAIETFNMRKEIFKVGYQKPKSSSLHGIESGSSCIVLWQLKKTSNKNKFIPGGNRTQVFKAPKIDVYGRITPVGYSCLEPALAKNCVVVAFTACFFHLKLV